MATKVVMEALSPTMEEGRLVEWKKQEGDAVTQGDVLADVETDKAVMELVARADGTLLKQVVEAGATVPVSELVAVIGRPGEDIAAITGGGVAGGKAAAPAKPAAEPAGGVSAPPAPPAAAAAEPRRAPAPPAPTPPAAAAPAAAPAAAVAPRRENGGRLKASPLARKVAAERGLDLRTVTGSGPEGRIVVRDLERAPAAAAAPAPSARPVARPSAGFEDIPLTQIRKAIAKRLAQSIGPIPTFYLTTEVDMERVWEARQALVAEEKGDAPRVSFNDIIIKATALALRQHPWCNAWWQDDRIRLWHDVHIGMAVAIEEGLITPVIRHADQKPLREIAAETRDLARRARERRLIPEEYTGSTFSISNLGMLDIDEFTAIINPPEAGIIAVGRIAETPVAHQGSVALRRRMRLTMSCDHRVIDGARGAEFLNTLKTMLENPLALVW